MHDWQNLPAHPCWRENLERPEDIHVDSEPGAARVLTVVVEVAGATALVIDGVRNICGYALKVLSRLWPRPRRRDVVAHMRANCRRRGRKVICRQAIPLTAEAVANIAEIAIGPNLAALQRDFEAVDLATMGKAERRTRRLRQWHAHG